MPNPGRMEELLFAGVTVYLVEMDTNRVKYPYKVVGIDSNHGPLMLDAIKNNEVAEYLINSGSIPSLNGYSIIRREVKYHNSRFDLLLSNGEDELFCEIKSCTLFGGDIAMFPDAVTKRGRRHVSELKEISTERGVKQAVLFIVHSSKVNRFIPDYHTDRNFSEELYNAKESLNIIPISIEWSNNLELSRNRKELPIDWNSYIANGRGDCGSYLIAIETDSSIIIDNSSNLLPSGVYMLLSSSNVDLSKNIKRSKVKRKKITTIFEKIRDSGKLVGTWPIITPKSIDIDIAKELNEISQNHLYNRGLKTAKDTDNSIFYFKKNPTRTRPFQQIIIKYRMEII
jgi:sugar fermentation stimulation protein A